MNDSHNGSLELYPSRIGLHRFGKTFKLIARFYEVLFLLKALGETRGHHTCQPRIPDAATYVRRRFLQNLCFICDFKKGGTTCTAIGLEDDEIEYRFWIASNKETAAIVEFLKNVLSFLQTTSCVYDDTELGKKRMELIRLCVEFEHPRIVKEQKLLQRDTQQCLIKLREQASTDDGFIAWLSEIIDHTDSNELCAFSHRHRQSEWMKKLKLYAETDESGRDLQVRRSPFFLVRHYIGRLSRHIRAPEELVSDSARMSYILHSYAVQSIKTPLSMQIPPRDEHTNLQGIVKRMFKENSKEVPRVEDGLIHLNRVSGIFEDFLKCYDQPDSTVHAEIQVLEHFHQYQLKYAENDRWIACSKPACFCCELYFKYHPSRMVVPPSHRKIWARWSPPCVKKQSQIEVDLLQQEVLNKIVQDIREQVIGQVLGIIQRAPWHPDSRSSLTRSHFDFESCTRRNPEWGETSDSEDGGVSLAT